MPKKNTLEAQKEKFLLTLAECPKVTFAAKVCGLSRAHLYALRQKDEDFGAAWDKAIIEGRSQIEDRAWEVGVEGLEEFVVSQGKIVIYKGKPLTVRNVATNVLLTMLKTYFPEYRDKQQIEHSGSIDTSGAKDNLRNRLAKHSGARK